LVGCGVGGDIGKHKLCTNPCRKNDDFLHYSEKNNLCYKSYSNVVAGENGGFVACDDWCTNDVNVGSGCGSNSL
jgi:hypothetical protein